ncbi:SDR family oxidoreductase [Caballeronia novacaledonica]|uniref:SDR family oxidoreductase n=1 Tax=Caballeronia novacaledonica TaxID=1544861 RepID=A0AA37IGS8_9BURK|nr:SDR family oxidoreductase [Caballeronia novacaledonica]GJH13258.1 SDR family oxidoreductase [Caballeronia novacaledonica]GJH28984.1 SDR family oxidoreductase [Caballeronia novacaledonica]
MSKTILITGAGSGLGEGAAIGLAQAGHKVIATAECWPQVTALRDKAASMNLKNMSVTKLNMLDTYDIANAARLDFDVLVNNAGIAEGGPVAEIPIPLVKQNFEVNVFALLDLTQRVVRRWVRSNRKGKVVFISSIVALVSPGMIGTYSATKHAVQSIAESMQDELKEFGIQVQTINPGPFFTGFNERGVEAAYRWLDDDANFTSRASYKAQTDALLDKPEMRLDPNDMIAKMVELIPSSTGPFRTIYPKDTADWAVAAEQAMQTRTI